MSRSGCYHYYTLVTTVARAVSNAPASACAMCVWMWLRKSLKAGRTRIFVQNLSKFNQRCVQNESHHLMQQRIVHDIISQSVIKDALNTGSGQCFSHFNKLLLVGCKRKLGLRELTTCVWLQLRLRSCTDAAHCYVGSTYFHPLQPAVKVALN